MPPQYPYGSSEETVINRRRMQSGPMSSQVGTVTVVLIGLCVAVALWSNLGRKEDVLTHLFITDRLDGLPEIFSGEVWRVVTPIFVHFGIMHLVFNMLWLKDLGTQIEQRQGGTSLLTMVAVIGAGSNLAQFYFHGPHFGGMSGVVYGLLGYVWMKAMYDPGCGLHVESSTMVMMIVWFVICWTNVLGPIANHAHTAGLLMGIFWGLGAPRLGHRRGDLMVG